MHETMVEYKSKIEKFYWRRQVGERIRETRIKMQLLPKDIEKLVFDEDSQWVSVNRINLIENGRPKKEFWPYIYVEIIPKIAQVLKVSVAWLLSGEENNIKVPVQSSLFKPEAGKEIFKNPAENTVATKKYINILDEFENKMKKMHELLCKNEAAAKEYLSKIGFTNEQLSNIENYGDFIIYLSAVNYILQHNSSYNGYYSCMQIGNDYVKKNCKISLYKIEEVLKHGKC